MGQKKQGHNGKGCTHAVCFVKYRKDCDKQKRVKLMKELQTLVKGKIKTVSEDYSLFVVIWQYFTVKHCCARLFCTRLPLLMIPRECFSVLFSSAVTSRDRRSSRSSKVSLLISSVNMKLCDVIVSHHTLYPDVCLSRAHRGVE